MNRKLVWLSILSILFLLWGGSGFVAAAPHKGPIAELGVPLAPDTSVAPQETQPALIPVTGSTGLGWGTLLFYGLVELATLTLILALLDAANQSTALYATRKTLREKTQNK